jgi:hypothetical protein
MKRKALFIAAALVVAIGAYIFVSQANDRKAEEVDARQMKQLVQNYSVGKLQAKSASITSRQLIVTDNDNRKVTYDLPKDEFFVSIAPYVKETHPCATHSLTGCQGELANKSFDVSIEDSKGKKVLEQKLTSQANGFIDLWLPRDQTYNITVNYEGKIAKSQFSTFDKDNTCITTIRLGA